ncbi:cytochrome-c peroxidase [Aliidiomarina shirensis]|uniref:Cytochrome-c peroxidase n=1 Tax=Aliidiomarina shirensis TaxID=1048642 RepID=A0A432WQ89_9GAMM|nr:cytochrome c peroxidase [Aliidiomarina shirensis]RUO35976.1 cytochrome-c peroxidase [Aliidiomarina shirensis]
MQFQHNIRWFRSEVWLVACICCVSLFHSAYADTSTSHCEIESGDIYSLYLQPMHKWPCYSADREDLEPLPKPVEVEQALVSLGETLFHDKNLSSDRSVSCASCHQPEHRFADPRRISPGVEGREGHRNTPSLMNVDLWNVLFWDGRESSLQHLAVQPLTNPLEMNSNPGLAVMRVTEQDRYKALVEEYFGDSTITWQRITEALAAFQLTLRSPENKLDTFLNAIADGNYEVAENALNSEQLLGLHLFRTKANCVACHQGALLSDQKFHNMGLHYFGRRFEDLGVFAVNGEPSDVGKFRTPTLRHLEETRPWMHNGLFDDLLGIVRMYSHGGPRPRPRGENINNPLFPVTTDELKPFNLTKEEEAALVEFLKVL